MSCTWWAVSIYLFYLFIYIWMPPLLLMKNKRENFDNVNYVQ